MRLGNITTQLLSGRDKIPNLTLLCFFHYITTAPTGLNLLKEGGREGKHHTHLEYQSHEVITLAPETRPGSKVVSNVCQLHLEEKNMKQKYFNPVQFVMHNKTRQEERVC